MALTGALISLSALLAVPAVAQVPDNVARVGIVPGWRDEDGRHVAGLSISLAPGWKTYWRAPGEGGIPPLFNWSGSSNVADVEVRYPVPDVFHQNGVRTIGYKDRVLFPLLIQPQDTAGTIRLTGEIEIGVCEEICIPVAFTVSAELTPAGRQSQALTAALNDRPTVGGSLRCEISPIADGLRVNVETDMQPMGGQEDFRGRCGALGHDAARRGRNGAANGQTVCAGAVGRASDGTGRGQSRRSAGLRLGSFIRCPGHGFGIALA